METALRRRVKAGHIQRIPGVLANVSRGPHKTPTQWRAFIKRMLLAFKTRFWFYHPVKCGANSYVSRSRTRGTLETYTCPNGTRKEFRRFLSPKDFFKWRYGRGAEFAQGLMSVLRHLGFRVRLVLGKWGPDGDALWCEVWHPWNRTWIPIDPTQWKGYGFKFPKKGMKVLALETPNGRVVDRTAFYTCQSGCLGPYRPHTNAMEARR